MNCPQCDAIMKLVPAGVSKKSGKLYKAFFSCPECKETVSIQEEPGVKKEFVQSSLPAKPHQPQNGNGSNLGMMRLAYRKDLMIAVINKWMETATTQGLKEMFNDLWAEIEK